MSKKGCPVCRQLAAQMREAIESSNGKFPSIPSFIHSQNGALNHLEKCPFAQRALYARGGLSRAAVAIQLEEIWVKS